MRSETTLTVAVLALLAAGAAHGADAPAKAANITEAITGGKAQVSFRMRYEDVDDDALNQDANALTLRSRLSWTSAPLNGVSAMLEVDDIRAIVEDYNSTSNGKTTYPIVGDPEGTEVNQAYLKWQIGKNQLIGGRQRVVLDNQRFIGNVGWRQNEQTYDSVAFKSTVLPRTEFTYAWVWNVNRVFGPKTGAQAANWHGDTHVINAKFNAGKAGSISAFAYLMDFDNAAAQSNVTYGVLWTGSPEIAKGWKLPFAFSYATQDDYKSNPVNYTADYWQAEAGISYGPHTIKVGREVLEGHATRAGASFRTPLATLHAFQGWVDKFLTTPPQGVEDTYVGFMTKVGPANCQVFWHDYKAEAVDRDYGTEWNASVGFAFAKRYELLFKAGKYNADGFGTDATKVWVMATATF